MIPGDDYKRILRAIATFEDGLRSRGTSRSRAWRERLLRDLRPVEEWLREHCRAAEAPGGTLQDVEIAIGRLSDVAAARREHGDLIALAASLVASAEGRSGAVRPSGGERRRGAVLADALRRHLVAEVDLLQIRYTLDVGVVD